MDFSRFRLGDLHPGQLLLNIAMPNHQFGTVVLKGEDTAIVVVSISLI
jgi:hypothetical protein